MTPEELGATWNAVAEKVSREGLASLSQAESTFYRLYRFLADFESVGLSGILYNARPPRREAGAWSDLDALAECLKDAAMKDIVPPAVHNAVRRVAHWMPRLPQRSDGAWETFLETVRPLLSESEEAIGLSTERLWRTVDRLAARIQGRKGSVLRFPPAK